MLWWRHFPRNIKHPIPNHNPETSSHSISLSLPPCETEKSHDSIFVLSFRLSSYTLHFKYIHSLKSLSCSVNLFKRSITYCKGEEIKVNSNRNHINKDQSFIQDMVRYHRLHQQWRKGDKHMEEDEESQALIMDCGTAGCYFKRTRPKLLSLLLLSLLSCCFLLAPHLYNSGSTFSLFGNLVSLMIFTNSQTVLFPLFCLNPDYVLLILTDSFRLENEGPVADMDANTPLCSSISNG